MRRTCMVVAIMNLHMCIRLGSADLKGKVRFYRLQQHIGVAVHIPTVWNLLLCHVSTCMCSRNLVPETRNIEMAA
ncbi:hypothetical protein BKA56DRAFT_587929 [Ilyonectria sp. MPI-CAGE-AT-0026]|nr:hypothetical protein BKA56DRAFT_587929 [Ilyonectria sp. MPI-CAGE-AT-0026]